MSGIFALIFLNRGFAILAAAVFAAVAVPDGLLIGLLLAVPGLLGQQE